ncbi:MAG: septum formation family protein [Propionicimonas sp.]
MSRTGRLAAALIAQLAILGLVGCAPAGPRDPDGQVTASVPTDAFSLQVGDCTGPLTSGTVGGVTLIPCAQPHAWEVFGATELPGEEYPGAGKVQDLAEEFCNGQFKAFIGVAVAKSKYHLTVLQPTKQTWNDAADRQVTCLAGDDDGKIEGTLAGAEK